MLSCFPSILNVSSSPLMDASFFSSQHREGCLGFSSGRSHLEPGLEDKSPRGNDLRLRSCLSPGFATAALMATGSPSSARPLYLTLCFNFELARHATSFRRAQLRTRCPGQTRRIWTAVALRTFSGHLHCASSSCSSSSRTRGQTSVFVS